MSLTRAACGCVRSATVVGTCPECLPAGAITWLIEHGRQLELFVRDGVLEPVRGLESIENREASPSNNPSPPGEGLPF